MFSETDAIIMIYFSFWLALAGAIMGSGLNCMAARNEKGESWARGRSKCDSCGHVLSIRDLVPLFSYIFFRGRCRYCGSKIPADCFQSEAAGAVMYLCLGLGFGSSLELGMWLVFGGLLLLMSLTEIRERMLPDRFLWLAALNRVLWMPVLNEPMLPALKAMLPGLAVSFLMFVCILVYGCVRGREIMGGVKILIVMALYLDLPGLLLALVTAGFLGNFVSIASGRRRGGKMAFAFFLTAGVVVSAAFGGLIVGWCTGRLYTQ